MKIKISIPSDLNDIKLSQYQKFLKTTKDSEDDDYINKQLVGIFCNLPDEAVKKMYKKDFNAILPKIVNVIKQEGTFKEIITIKGKEYGFIPSLDNITVGEQADIDTLVSDWQKMDKVMAVLYRPIKSKSKGKYLIEDYTGDEQPLDVSMEVATGALVFFFNLLNDLLICTQSYMNQVVQNPKNLQLLEKNGVGINQFTQWLEATCSNLRQSLN